MFSRNVPDSSMTKIGNTHQSDAAYDATIKMGMIKRSFKGFDGNTYYTVECNHRGNITLMDCRLMMKFGGPHNFEEYHLRAYNQQDLRIPGDRSALRGYDVRVGDVVVVGCLSGSARTGVILGCLAHGARTDEIPIGDIAYINCFNGIETKITKDGTYSLTFKGRNLALLDLHIPGTPVPSPQYDPIYGGTFLSLINDGSFIVSDGKTQSIKIDKSGAAITITSGGSSITINATDTNIKSTNVAIGSSTSVKVAVAANEIAIDGVQKVAVKAAKISIGSGPVELIDVLIKLIDAIGSLVVTSPVGPCSPVNSAPTWSAQVELIKQQLSSIKA